MRSVRNVLRALEEEYGSGLGEQLAQRSVVLLVDPRGKPYIEVEGAVGHPVTPRDFKLASKEIMLDLLAEYEPGTGLHGPHLLVPRPGLRIVPGKLGGEPHVEHTRIETRVLQALSRRGYSLDDLLKFYPFLEPGDVAQALDLEEQLDRNIATAA
jgi:uncharacterized protein (DUF433 family)